MTTNPTLRQRIDGSKKDMELVRKNTLFAGKFSPDDLRNIPEALEGVFYIAPIVSTPIIRNLGELCDRQSQIIQELVERLEVCEEALNVINKKTILKSIQEKDDGSTYLGGKYSGVRIEADIMTNILVEQTLPATNLDEPWEKE